MGREVEYFTHDNGGRPFIVVWDSHSDTVDIFHNLRGRMRGKWIARYSNVTQFHAGTDPISNSPQNTGNTVLFSYLPSEYDDDDPSGPFSYVWVGSDVLEFTLPEKVEYYVSRIGNSDVPYPYAVTKSRTYLWVNNRVGIDNSALPCTPPTGSEYAKELRSRVFPDYVRGTMDPVGWYSHLSEEERAAISQPFPTVTIIVDRNSVWDEIKLQTNIVDKYVRPLRRMLNGVAIGLGLTSIYLTYKTAK